jgi:hypothetical protein
MLNIFNNKKNDNFLTNYAIFLLKCLGRKIFIHKNNMQHIEKLKK